MTQQRDHSHAEAFCVMQYLSDDGTEVEHIWNSRDGVTPFVVTLRSGKTAKHVNWHADVPIPDYKPPVGSRAFVDNTLDNTRLQAQITLDTWLKDDTRDVLGELMGTFSVNSVDALKEKMAADYLRHFPFMLIEVTQEWLDAREPAHMEEG